MSAPGPEPEERARLERLERRLDVHEERLHTLGNRITVLEGQARQFLPREEIRALVEDGFARRMIVALSDSEVERRFSRLISEALISSGVVTEDRFRNWLLAFFAGMASLVGILSYLRH